MENIQVLRLEITGNRISGKDSKSLDAGTLIATGAVGAGIKSFKEQYNALNTFGVKGQSPIEKKLQRAVGVNIMKHAFNRTPGLPMPAGLRVDGFKIGAKTYIDNINYKSLNKNMTKGATMATAAYGLYSQHQSIGYNLSGATHAGQMQQRKAQGAAFMTGIGVSLATGQYLATALMLAGRAWQLGQQNRQELYQIRSSQIISGILQERLVKDTIQRRF
jgi:hypothetical protein